MKSKKGISLIVLIITIIVVIILAAVVILTLSKNNPIESAKEARFKEDVRTFQDELALYISKQYANAGGHWDGNISAKSYNEIVDYIPSFTKKYEGKFIINNNNLEYTNKLDDKEKEYSQNLNVRENVFKLLPDEYQQVEYIESTGTQWIDARLNSVSKKARIKVKFMLLKKKDYAALFCSRSSSFDGRTLFVLQLDGFRNDQNNKQTNVNYNLQLSTVYTVDSSQTYFKLNDEVLYEYPENTGMDLDNKFTLLNCNNYLNFNEMSEVFGFEGKIYYYKIYDESLIRNLIPCYANTTVINVDGVECSANTKGLYDTVEGKFYTNQGTGEFIAGPDVNE